MAFTNEGRKKGQAKSKQVRREKKVTRMGRFLAAFQRNGGFVSKACRAAGITPQTFREWRKLHPEFEQLVDDVAEGNLDVAEQSLMKSIRSGNAKAIMFYLDRKGKGRGYGIQFPGATPQSPLYLDASPQLIDTIAKKHFPKGSGESS